MTWRTFAPASLLTKAGRLPDKKRPPYNAFISAIESIGAVEPRDHIGLRFRESGFVETTHFDAAAVYSVNVELWDFADRTLREARLTQLVRLIEAQGGEVLDQYIGPSITMLRARTSGSAIQELLNVEVVASVDEPPLNGVPEDAPLIGVIDSGVNAHPFLEDILVGSIGVPETLGTADDWGHGTRVAGVAVLGDLRAQLAAGTLDRGARLCSAKVINAHGRFDDRRVVPSQMREALTTLHARFDCRIFVLSLGDPKLPYGGGKVGSWAATLDELARELIVLSVGAWRL
jgi:hypothetical protein